MVTGAAEERVDVVIPIYKRALDEMELFSIDYSLHKLAGRRIVFIHPHSLDTGWYRERFTGDYLPLPDEFFASHRNYNQLCYEVAFYQLFTHATHMLLLQPDAIIVGGDLDAWCRTQWDYLGGPECGEYSYDLRAVAPFSQMKFLPPVRLMGCNGGLSLRRIQAFIDVLQEYPDLTQFFRSYGVGIGEDIFYSLMGRVSRRFQVPNEIIASRFAVTGEFQSWVDFNGGELPFGFHAWYRNEQDQQTVLQLIAADAASKGNTQQ